MDQLEHPLPEVDEEALERNELHLSKLSTDALEDYLKASNMDLRQAIASLRDQFHVACYEGLLADDRRGMVLISQIEEALIGGDVRYLPQKRDIKFHPIQEMENMWLGDLLYGLVLELKLAILENF